MAVAANVKLMADILKSELSHLSFPAPLSSRDKRSLIKRLFDSPPSRSELAFQTLEGESAAKHIMAKEISEEELKDLFCMVHAAFVRKSGVDVAHAFAHSYIRKNQIALLKFLNKNKKFAEALLALPGITDFFQRDAEGKIKGTGYFYKICYNDTENLWLLCHACNIHKSDGDSLEWFRKQKPYFGEPFVKAVNEAGGLQSGIVLDRIFKPGDTDLTYEGRTIQLSGAASQGLGAFVRQWFFENHRDQFEVHRQFHTQHYGQLKASLLKLLELKENNKQKEYNKYKKRLKRDLRELETIQSEMDAWREEASTSGSETKSQEDARVTRAGIRRKEEAMVEHAYGQLRQCLKDEGHYSDSELKMILEGDYLTALDASALEKIHDDLALFLKSAPNKTPPVLTIQMKTWYEQYKEVPSETHKAVVNRAAEEARGRAAEKARADALEAELAQIRGEKRGEKRKAGTTPFETHEAKRAREAESSVGGRHASH